MLWFVPLAKTTASQPIGLLDAQGRDILTTLTVPDLGPGRYVPVRRADARDGAEPGRLLFYPQGWHDPIAVSGPIDVDGTPHYRLSATVVRNREPIEQYLTGRGLTVETEPEALRKDSRKRGAMRVRKERLLRNSAGKPVGTVPDWCIGNARALATAGEDPEEMQEMPDLEVIEAERLEEVTR